MKTLSVKNPYAYLIVYGIKDIENRSWQTKYRGKLYIHASGVDMAIYPNNTIDKETKAELDKLVDANLSLDECYKQGSERLIKYYELYKKCDSYFSERNEYFLKKNRIIGSVELEDIIKDSKSPFAEKGQYHWIFKNPVIFEKPIENIKGKLNLWEFNI